MAVDRTLEWQYIPASQTAALIGQAGIGVHIKRIIVSSVTSATATCSITDGSTGTAMVLTSANTPLGAHSIELEISSKSVTATTGWYITTGAGATAIVVGKLQKG